MNTQKKVPKEIRFLYYFTGSVALICHIAWIGIGLWFPVTEIPYVKFLAILEIVMGVYWLIVMLMIARDYPLRSF